jgi:hypothetical protein
VVCIGDSITAGLRASVALATDPAQYAVNSWVALLRAHYQARYGDGGYGFIPTFTGGPATAGTNPIVYPYLWVPSGTWDELPTGYAYGPFGRALRATGAGNTLSLTAPPCDSIDLHYFRSDLTTGTWTYTVDGGAPHSVVQTAAAGIVYAKETISGLAMAAHAVVITAPAVGSVHISGANCRKGTAGARVHNIGRGSSGVLDYAPDAERPKWASLLAPSLTIINTAVIDHARQTPLDTYSAALQRICDAAAGGDILCLGPNPTGTNFTIPQSSYHAALRTAAAGSGGRFLDLIPFFASATAMFAAGDIDDSLLHPTLTGHARWAGRLLQELPA